MNERRSALTLTDAEWRDLAEICRHYRSSTQWIEHDALTRREPEEHVAMLQRQRALCERIEEAA